MRARQYKTNDIVEIPAAFSLGAEGLKVGINGSFPGFGKRESLLLRVLALYAVGAEARGPEPASAASPYLSVGEIMRRIDQLRNAAGLGEFWSNMIDCEVYTVICSIRRHLMEAGLNRHLVEGSRGSGYRLSTPPWNVILRPPNGDDIIWGAV
jgi:hypothetical protein